MAGKRLSEMNEAQQQKERMRLNERRRTDRLVAQVSESARNKRNERQRQWYEDNLQKARAAARERVRKYRERKREEMNRQRRERRAAVSRLEKARHKCAGWRWRSHEREIDENYSVGVSPWDWYEQWFASLDNPDLYPWACAEDELSP